MVSKKIYNKLFVLLLFITTLLILSGCSNKIQIKSNNSSTIENINKTPSITALDKIETLKSLKFERDANANLIPFDEVISLIGSEGELAYPIENDKDLKVMFWIYTKNEIEYYLDTTFYMDKLVNIESRIVSTSNIVDIPSNSLSPNYKNEITEIKDYSKLKEILGEGTLVMNYFVPGNDRIYIWKYNNDFISAYVSQENSISYIKISSDVNSLIISSTNCH